MGLNDTNAFTTNTQLQYCHMVSIVLIFFFCNFTVLDYIRSRMDWAENHISEGSQLSEEEDFFSSLNKPGPLENVPAVRKY